MRMYKPVGREAARPVGILHVCEGAMVTLSMLVTSCPMDPDVDVDGVVAWGTRRWMRTCSENAG